MKLKLKAKILLGTFVLSSVISKMSTFSVLHAAGKSIKPTSTAQSNAGPDNKETDKNGNTPLHKAALKGSMDEFKSEVSKYLGESRYGESRYYALIGKLNIKNNHGDTVLHAAIRSENLKLVIHILNNYNIDLNMKNNDGQTPLALVQELINSHITQLAIHGASSAEDQKRNQKEIICNSESISKLQRLEKAIKDTRKIRAFFFRRNGRCLECIKKFITKDTANTEVYGYPLLLCASDFSDPYPEMAQYLIDNGAIVPEHNYEHIIEFVIDHCTIKQLEKLLLTGRSTPSNPTSYALAYVLRLYGKHCANSKQLGVLRHLLEQFRVNPIFQKSYVGCAHLFSAIESGDVELVRSLLDHGADVNSISPGNSSPLHHAISWNANFNIARLLIERGADIDAVDRFGYTPLLWACSVRGGKPIAKFLLEKGANPYAKDQYGEKPNISWIKRIPYLSHYIFAHPSEQNDLA